jgi:hypothetical protein
VLPSLIGESEFDSHIGHLLPPLRQLYRNVQAAQVSDR